jgi:NADH:ubiquinone oxidoreductase subunit D
MNDKWPHGEVYTIVDHNNGTNENDIFNDETNGSFRWGVRVSCCICNKYCKNNKCYSGWRRF